MGRLVIVLIAIIAIFILLFNSNIIRHSWHGFLCALPAYKKKKHNRTRLQKKKVKKVKICICQIDPTFDHFSAWFLHIHFCYTYTYTCGPTYIHAHNVSYACMLATIMKMKFNDDLRIPTRSRKNESVWCLCVCVCMYDKFFKFNFIKMIQKITYHSCSVLGVLAHYQQLHTIENDNIGVGVLLVAILLSLYTNH